MLENIQNLKERQLQLIESETAELLNYCNTHPEIKEFVNFIVSEYPRNTIEEYIQYQLKGFIYEITGYSLNNVDYFPGFFFELNSFIGNFFLDDASFNLKEEKFAGKMIYKAYGDYDTGTQDPKVLIDAARHNAEIYFNIDNRIRK